MMSEAASSLAKPEPSSAGPPEPSKLGPSKLDPSGPDLSKPDPSAPATGAEPAAPILSVEGLSLSIDGVEILHDITMSVEKGGFLSILGPNGAGKSTLLRTIMRLDDRGRRTGTVQIEGQELSRYSQKSLARVVSYVPQGGGWIPPFEVVELCRLSRFPFASAVSGLSETDRQAVSEALELTGLTAMARRRLKTLSGGERQKAYLAAALAQRAPIMLLDEPAASLDPRHAAELAELLARLNRERSLTMLMVTHDLNHPLRAGGRALVLKNGRRLYLGPVAGLEGEVLARAFDHRFLYLDHPSGTGRVVLSQ
jgi:iron complex transport system ATP-binding protein